MIDVHTHILPNIDDGAKNVEETFELIHEAYTAGFTDIITTSHYIEGQYEVNKYDRKCIIKALQDKINQDNINIKLHNGAEAYISEEIPELINRGIISTLADSRYILFELPLYAKVIYAYDVIDKLLELGYIPVIAHPERYRIVQEDIKLAISYIKRGALLQSNYESIIGRYGNKAKETLLKLLDMDAVHFLGTDTHRENTIYSEMDIILKELKRKIGKEKLEILTKTNPRKILKNEPI